MDIKFEKRPDNSATISLTFDEPDYRKDYQKKLNEYAKKISLKGFRPGKVPPALIEKMYGKSVLAEAIDTTLKDKLFGYIEENNIKLLTQARPSNLDTNIDWENDKQFTFNFDLAIQPDFEIDIEKQAFTKYVIELTDDEIDDVINGFAKDLGSNQSAEISEIDDLLEVQITGPSVDVKTKILVSQILEKNQKKFVGVKVGDKITADLKKTIAEAEMHHMLNMPREEAAKLKGDYVFEVLDILRFTNHPINQELFDKILGKDKVTTFEEFKAEFKTIYENVQNDNSRSYLAMQIKETLLRQNELVFPEKLLFDWYHEDEHHHHDHHHDDEHEHEHSHTHTQEEWDELQKKFEKHLAGLRWDVIKARVTESVKIEVSQEEILQTLYTRVRRQLAQMGMDAAQFEPMLPNIVNNLVQDKNGKHVDEAYAEALENKFFDAVMEKANITEEKVSLKEFKEASEKYVNSLKTK